MENLIERELFVVKVGTNTLIQKDNSGERLHDESFESIGQQVRELTDEGGCVVLVSSAAITAGVVGDGKERDGTEEVVELQRYAARGWDTVVQKWKSTIGAERVSATLLTKREIHNDNMRKKALGVIACCLEHDDVFVVNENDTISDDEIKFGDNDALAAELAVALAQAGMFKSVQLVLLTDEHGLYKDVKDKESLIRKVTDIGAVEEYAGGASTVNSSGGMLTKVASARKATETGIKTYIANGRVRNAIKRCIAREIGTYFAASN
jgi:glutamate 5-kinase